MYELALDDLVRLKRMINALWVHKKESETGAGFAGKEGCIKGARKVKGGGRVASQAGKSRCPSKKVFFAKGPAQRPRGPSAFIGKRTP